MKFNRNMKLIIVLLTATALLLSTACKAQDAPGTQVSGEKAVEAQNSDVPDSSGLSGKISVDGSSTVYPITEAVAEEFKQINPGIQTSVASSGTGGGMKKFVMGEIDICDASRKIKDDEAKDAKKNSIDFVEFKVAFDGITVVVNPKNTWAESITADELKKVWEPGSKVKTWKDIRAQWPAEPIELYGPGTDSGTFEYFTEAITGKKGAIRKDFTPSEDDNVLVQGIAGDKNAMGYFGYAYYEENKDKIKDLGVDTGKGPVKPGFDTIKNGTYKPLSRPLFLYVSKKSMDKPQVKEFIKYYLTEGYKLIKDVGYVPLDDSEYKAQLDTIK